MPQYEEFRDSTVVVTGASAGMGRAVALGFGREGARVFNADVREDPKIPDEQLPTHERIEEHTDGSAEFVETDVSDLDDLEALFDVVNEAGGVDVMVNNAGILLRDPFREVSEEDFEALHQVNTKGVFFGSQLAANSMVEHDIEGAIVNFSSMSSKYSLPEQTAYDPTKAAVQMMTRTIALELSDHGIRANCVAPGIMATEILEGWSQEADDAVESGEGFHKPIPLDRPGYVEDIVDPVLFLASPGADYVTGATLRVDGGFTIW